MLGLLVTWANKRHGVLVAEEPDGEQLSKSGFRLSQVRQPQKSSFTLRNVELLGGWGGEGGGYSGYF